MEKVISHETKNKTYIPPSSEIIVKTLADVKGFDCNTVLDVPVSECQVLVDLYQSTNGAGWINNSNWLSSTYVNNWFGIGVESNHVVYIILQNNKLSGSLPDSLGDLNYLEALALTNSNITGTIPSKFGQLLSLKMLVLFDNNLSGSIPESLGNLTNLWSLDLCLNQLIGVIPSSLGNLINLNRLNLRNNQLSGSIPDSLGYLINLEILYLGVNQLTGPIPSSLGNLIYLQQLMLYYNQLTGTIPDSLGNLVNLTYLPLQENQLIGNIPLSFTNLLSLNSFYFYSTNLCEPTTPEFLSWKETVGTWEGTGIVCEITPVPWLLMYYLAGDSDDFLNERVNTYAKVLESFDNPNTNIAVFIDDRSSSRYIGISSNGKVSIDKAELNTGDPQTLTNFINWAKTNYPETHTKLTIFDHGNALSGVAGDFTSNDLLTPTELKQALSDIGHIDVLHVYTCLMANLEAQYQLRGLVNYYISSENKGHSDEYGLVFKHYIPKISNSTTPRELAINVGKSYFNYISSNTIPSNISVVDISIIEDVAAKTSTLADEIRSKWYLAPLIWEYSDYRNLQRFDSNGNNIIDNDDLLADLYDFANLLSSREEFHDDSTELMNSIDNYVIYNKAISGQFLDGDNVRTYNLENSHGVSIGLPRTKISFYNGDWLDFATGANWIISPLSIPSSTKNPDLSWGNFVSDFVLEFNPDEPDMSSPPPLIGLIDYSPKFIRLPLIVR